MASSRTAAPLIVLLVTALLAGCSGSPHGATAAGDTSASASSSPTYGSAGPDGSPSTDPSGYASPSPTRTTPPPATTRPAPPPVAGSTPAAQAILAQVNAWRTSMGLRPYTMSSGLIASAHRHNLVMVSGCGLSHHCPGEADLGDRISAQGVHWTSAGENIGEAGRISDNQTAITNAAKGLDSDMFGEKPPDDGHRRNILSSSFTHIGIDVVRDSKGTVWITQDFSN